MTPLPADAEGSHVTGAAGVALTKELLALLQDAAKPRVDAAIAAGSCRECVYAHLANALAMQCAAALGATATEPEELVGFLRMFLEALNFSLKANGTRMRVENGGFAIRRPDDTPAKVTH